MGSRRPCRFTEGYQVNFKRQKTSNVGEIVIVPNASGDVGENVPNDSCGSSGDPITTAPIDLEIVNPDPVSTGLQWLRMY